MNVLFYDAFVDNLLLAACADSKEGHSNTYLTL